MLSLVDLIQKIFYNISWLSQFDIFTHSFFTRTKAIYIIKFIECIIYAVVLKKQVIYINYVPVWNPLISILARAGVKLGPITGSLDDIPTDISLAGRLLRGKLQKQLIRFTKVMLPNNQNYWTATPSVHAFLKDEKLETSNGYPFYRR